MALFYVIYLHDGASLDCIEAIRLLCDPSQKKASHLTVRGPFPNKIRLVDANKKLAGNKLLLNGVNRFFSESQNTVFFTCSATKIKRVWNKPDYPFNPHITIYDGDSRTFASEVFDLVSKHSYLLGFHADKLTPLVSKSGAKNSFRPLSFDLAAIAEITGELITTETINHMSLGKRLTLIEQLCAHLKALSLKTDPNFLTKEGGKDKDRRTMIEMLRHAFSY